MPWLHSRQECAKSRFLHRTNAATTTRFIGRRFLSANFQSCSTGCLFGVLCPRTGVELEARGLGEGGATVSQELDLKQHKTNKETSGREQLPSNSRKVALTPGLPSTRGATSYGGQGVGTLLSAPRALAQECMTKQSFTDSTTIESTPLARKASAFSRKPIPFSTTSPRQHAEGPGTGHRESRRCGGGGSI